MELYNTILNKGIKFGDFNHEVYTFKFDTRHIFLSEDYRLLIQTGCDIWNKIKYLNPDVLFTKGLAGMPILLSVKEAAYNLDAINLSCLVVRDSRKSYGSLKLIEGELPHSLLNKNAIFIDDIINYGTTIKNAIKALREEDYVLNYAGVACILNLNETNNTIAIRSNDIPVISLYTHSDFGLSKENNIDYTLIDYKVWETETFHAIKNPVPWKSAPVIDQDLLTVGNDNNHHYCFDKHTGDISWINESANPHRRGDSSVTQVFLGNYFWSSYDGTVKCVNRKSGNTIWETHIDQNLHSSPCLDSENNRLFIGTEKNKMPLPELCYGEGDIVCLTMDTGHELWRFNTAGMIPCTPVYSSITKTVICGSNDFYIYILSDTGKLIKKIATRGEVKGKPTLSDDGLIVFCQTRFGILYAISLKDASVLWEKQIGFSSTHPYPLSYDDKVVTTNQKGMAVCLYQQTGKVVWASRCDGDLGWGLVKFRDMLLGITSDGIVYTFNKNTGKKITKDDISKIIGKSVSIYQPPAFDEYHMYIVPNDTGILCFKLYDDPTRPQ